MTAFAALSFRQSFQGRCIPPSPSHETTTSSITIALETSSHAMGNIPCTQDFELKLVFLTKSAGAVDVRDPGDIVELRQDRTELGSQLGCSPIRLLQSLKQPAKVHLRLRDVLYTIGDNVNVHEQAKSLFI